jgi:hypothetical protein
MAKRRSHLGFGLLALVGLLGAACPPPSPTAAAMGADGPPRLDLSPTAVSVDVGASTVLMPRLDGSPFAADAPSWSTSDPGVAIVDGMGNVTCVGPGTATITASLEGAGQPAGATSRVTCIAVTLIRLSETRLAYEHEVGRSPCPDIVGEFTVTNTSDEPVVVEAVSGNSALRVLVNGLRLEPGQSLSVRVLFDCSRRTSFEADVTVRASTDGGSSRSQTAVVPVMVTFD